MQGTDRWVFWGEARWLLGAWDGLLLDFVIEGLLHPAPDALHPFERAEVMELVRAMEADERQEQEGER